MSISIVELDNPNKVWIDTGGRSIGYFCLKKPVRVDINLLDDLKKIADGLGGEKNIRLCLHENPDSSFHEMIIIENKGLYYPPHKHLKKGESYHIIEGAMAAFIFDEEGEVIDACEITPNNNFIYRVGINMYHAVMPLSDRVIYHESKPGPFLGDNDSVSPAWAPNSKIDEEIDAYRLKLKRALIQFKSD